MHPDAEAALQSAVAFATERRAGWGVGHHLLHALTRVFDGPAADLLARYGASSADVNAKLATGLYAVASEPAPPVRGAGRSGGLDETLPVLFGYDAQRYSA
jgi:hypothetical protein